MRRRTMRAELSTRFIGWCPICERDIKVHDDLLVHHGYLRPGVGYIVGDCFGVNLPPYELSYKAAELYLHDVVAQYIRNLERDLRMLQGPTGPEWLTFEDYDIGTRRVRRDPQSHQPIMVQLSRAEADERAAQLPGYDRDRYNWDQRLRIVIANVESDLRGWDRDRVRLEQLVRNWSLQELRTVEEEVQRNEQIRSDRDAARSAARDAKISAEVVKLRKRIDSAVRNKNSSVLADVFTSKKIRDMSDGRITQEQALTLLERDAIWRAFGLLTPSGYAVPGGLMSADSARELLEVMARGIWTPRAGGGFDVAPMPWPAELGGGVAKSRW